MHERCLMLRPRTQTSSPPAGRVVGTPCMTSCRVPLTPRDGRCPSPCLSLSCISTREAETETTPRTARAPPQPRGRPSRGTANFLHNPASRPTLPGWFPAVMNLFVQSRSVAGG